MSATYHNPSTIPSRAAVAGSGLDGTVQLRAGSGTDAEACLAVQRRSTIKGYAQIFPQDQYPFPDDVVRAEWVARLASPAQVVLAVVDGEVVGTVSARPPRLEALFVVPEHWGGAVASRLHDEALWLITAAGCESAQLDVMVDNARARRFYERRGWVLDGRRMELPFPPYPMLVGYRRDLGNVGEAPPHATIDA
jgi:GNAT superfamily N-acetyltransferase